MVTGSRSGGSWPGRTATNPPLLAPTLDLLDDLGPLPGEKAPIQASQRWHVERTHAWQNAFHRLARCYERPATVVNAFFDLADAIITIRSLIRQAWTAHRWDDRFMRRP